MVEKTDIRPFLSDDTRTSILHGVPIQHRDEIIRRAKLAGVKIKIRYRGPRSHNKYRGSFVNRCSCLMKDATSFAVYPRRPY